MSTQKSQGDDAKAQAQQHAAALQCLRGLVEQIRTEAQAQAGEYEGLFAYGLLTRLQAQARALGLEADIGLGGLDIDSLLRKPKKAA